MIAIHVHFFHDLYAKLRASWCSIQDVKDIWWRQNEVWEKSKQHRNELTKASVSDGVPKSHLCLSSQKQNWGHSYLQNFHCGWCSFKMVQAHKKFILGRIVPLKILCSFLPIFFFFFKYKTKAARFLFAYSFPLKMFHSCFKNCVHSIWQMLKHAEINFERYFTAILCL